MNQLGENSKVDLTPMLDVVFIMLIFFIVTATFIVETGLDVNCEEKNPPPDPPDPEKKSILVNITSNDRFLINGADVDVRLLRPQFERLSAQNAKAPVVVNPHELSSTEALVRVMDSASEAGITNIQFAYSGL